MGHSISCQEFLEGLLRDSFGKLTIDVEKIGAANRGGAPKLTKRCFQNRIYYVSKRQIGKPINRDTAVRLYALYSAILCGHSSYTLGEVSAISAVLAVWLGRISGLKFGPLACDVGDEEVIIRAKSTLLCNLLLRAVSSAVSKEYFDCGAMREVFEETLKSHLNEPQVSAQITTILDCSE